jgi:hypothetical protein
MDRLKTDELVIRVDRTVPSCLRLEWQGRSDGLNPGETIGPFFERILAEAKSSECYIDMHFEGLHHFNSATIASLIQLMYAAGKAKVPLRIVYDAKLSWQALAFEGLERAAHSFGNGEWPKVEFFPVHV